MAETARGGTGFQPVKFGVPPDFVVGLDLDLTVAFRAIARLTLFPA
jgi:hypothetical protein